MEAENLCLARQATGLKCRPGRPGLEGDYAFQVTMGTLLNNPGQIGHNALIHKGFGQSPGKTVKGDD